MTGRPPEGRLAVQVTAATLVRLVANIGHRMVYPFLPAIARGLGVSISSAGLLVTARSAVGLASPLFGPLSDRFGRRTMMASDPSGWASATISTLAREFGSAHG